MVVILILNSRKGVRKGEELKAPRYASTVLSCDDHVTTYNIIPNSNKIEYNNNNSLLNIRFRSLLGPRGLLLIYMWGENPT